MLLIYDTFTDELLLYHYDDKMRLIFNINLNGVWRDHVSYTSSSMYVVRAYYTGTPKRYDILYDDNEP